MPKLRNSFKKIKSGLSHALSVEPEEPFQPTERQKEILDKLAGWVVKKRLTVPVVMFLESITPLNFIGSQVLVFFHPFVTAFLSSKDYKEFQQMLEYRQSIPFMIEAIESRENQRSDAGKSREESSASHQESGKE